jgi:hypothetical protein
MHQRWCLGRGLIPGNTFCIYPADEKANSVVKFTCPLVAKLRTRPKETLGTVARKVLMRSETETGQK